MRVSDQETECLRQYTHAYRGETFILRVCFIWFVLWPLRVVVVFKWAAFIYGRPYASEEIVKNMHKYITSIVWFNNADIPFGKGNAITAIYALSKSHSPDSKVDGGQHGAHLGPVGPRWAQCCPHQPCYHGLFPNEVCYLSWVLYSRTMAKHGTGNCPKTNLARMSLGFLIKCHPLSLSVRVSTRLIMSYFSVTFWND